MIQYFDFTSGFPFTFGAKGEIVFILMTTGMLSFSVAWAVDEEGNALVPPISATNINNIFKYVYVSFGMPFADFCSCRGVRNLIGGRGSDIT